MDRRKVISDWIVATQETIYTLQMWLNLLETWQTASRAEPDDFMDACQQLKEARLWPWASQAGGHGIKALAAAVRIGEVGPDEVPLDEVPPEDVPPDVALFGNNWIDEG